MGKQPMTPERFQQRDVKRRLTKLEDRFDYRSADIARLVKKWAETQAEVARLEQFIDELEQDLIALQDFVVRNHPPPPTDVGSPSSIGATDLRQG